MRLKSTYINGDWMDKGQFYSTISQKFSEAELNDIDETLSRAAARMPFGIDALRDAAFRYFDASGDPKKLGSFLWECADLCNSLHISLNLGAYHVCRIIEGMR